MQGRPERRAPVRGRRVSANKPTSRVTITEERAHRVGLVPGRKFFPGTRGAALQPPGPYLVKTTLDSVPSERVPRALTSLGKPGRGRPKGTSFEAELAEMRSRCVTAGEPKYSVATEIARRGLRAEASITARADYLVDLYSDRWPGE